MKFSLPIAVLLVVASANVGSAQSYLDPPSPNRRSDVTASPNGFVRRAGQTVWNMFQGIRLQEDTSSLPAGKLTYTIENGAERHSYVATQRAGKNGPLLLQDTHLLDTLAHFVRERIPERVVHARGLGAHGRFEITEDFAEQYTSAPVFKEGTNLPVTVRFSTVGGGRGSPDTARDPRGFAVKIRTKQGILDWVFNNTPVFFIRDPSKFRAFIHTQKTHWATNLRDKNMVFDYLQQNHEAALQFLRLFSDLGTPYSPRFMSGWSGHTYRLVQNDGSWVYTRVLLETDQGVKNFTGDEATKMSGQNQEFATQDLYEAIEKGDYPSWTIKLAVMTPEQAAKYKYDVLDLTKDWLDVPYHKIGKLTLTQNPVNYHEEIEQSHFSPSNMVPGWAPSEDPVLQSRLFSYNDAARHRLGPNYLSIPVNCPYSTRVANFDRDGSGSSLGNGGLQQPNYHSSAGGQSLTFPAPIALVRNALQPNASVEYYESALDADTDYAQPRQFYNVQLGARDREHLADNFVGALKAVTQPGVTEGVLRLFGKIDAKLEGAVRAELAK